MKPLNLWATDEGVGGMELASNLIPRVVPLGSFHPLDPIPRLDPQWVPQLVCIGGLHGKFTPELYIWEMLL